jgi:hypothetical protein
MSTYWGGEMSLAYVQLLKVVYKSREGGIWKTYSDSEVHHEREKQVWIFEVGSNLQITGTYIAVTDILGYLGVALHI